MICWWFFYFILCNFSSVPNGKQDLKELTQIICTGANSLLSLNFSKFKKKARAQCKLKYRKKFYVWSVPKELQTKEELLQSVIYFFHNHEFKLKTGQTHSNISMISACSSVSFSILWLCLSQFSALWNRKLLGIIGWDYHVSLDLWALHKY